MIRQYRVEAHNKLAILTKPEWDSLFQDSLSSFETIQTLDQTSIDGFSLHSIVVYLNKKPALLLPLFKTKYYLGAMTSGTIKKNLDVIDQKLPRLLNLQLLRIGNEHYGEIGYDHGLSEEDLDKAWDLALEALEEFCQNNAIDLTAFTKFTSSTSIALPMHKLTDYHVTSGVPFVQIAVNFPSTDAYLMSMSKDFRHFLRRSIRKSQPVKLFNTQDPTPWLEDIYRLYLEQIKSHETNLNEVQNIEYFAKICKIDPNAKYFLYLLDNKLIGFELICQSTKCLLSKITALDPILGRKYNLYFRSWMDLVSYAINAKIPVIDLGCTGEELKIKLGQATVTPSFILFKHRNPIFNFALGRFKRLFAYQSKIELPQASLSPSFNDKATQAPSLS